MEANDTLSEQESDNDNGEEQAWDDDVDDLPPPPVITLPQPRLHAEALAHFVSEHAKHMDEHMGAGEGATAFQASQKVLDSLSSALHADHGYVLAAAYHCLAAHPSRARPSSTTGDVPKKEGHASCA